MPINEWRQTVELGDVFHDESRTFEERRDEIVRRLRAHQWVLERGGLLADLVEELGDAATGDEFDGPWSVIYDLADGDRVWIETIRSEPRTV